MGGETLTIEAVMTPGKGRMTVTGNLKEVMKESIQAANGYVRSRAIDLGIKPPLFDTRDIHVHVPEGATPKDGPSAGVGMATAIVSVMTGIPVRHDVAMTGEVTLRGRVLPIGGLKEKLLAALRFGIKTVLIPAENVRDLKEIPEIVTKGMEIIPVSRMDEVLSRALVRQPEPIEWNYDEAAKVAPVVADLSARRRRSGQHRPLVATIHAQVQTAPSGAVFVLRVASRWRGQDDAGLRRRASAAPAEHGVAEISASSRASRPSTISSSPSSNVCSSASTRSLTR